MSTIWGLRSVWTRLWTRLPLADRESQGATGLYRIILTKVDGLNMKPGGRGNSQESDGEDGVERRRVLQVDEIAGRLMRKLKAKGVEFLSPCPPTALGVECIAMKDNSNNWFSMTQ